jgi:Rrf2 family iron-sulfur cluster assembly transcriptional regulator
MPFRWKILRKLSQEKLVRSFKGVHRGYELAGPASNIRLSEILLMGHDGARLGDRVLGPSTCNDQEPCPRQARWKDVREEIEKRVKNTRPSELARNLRVHPGKRPKRPTLVSVAAR